MWESLKNGGGGISGVRNRWCGIGGGVEGSSYEWQVVKLLSSLQYQKLVLSKI